MSFLIKKQFKSQSQQKHHFSMGIDMRMPYRAVAMQIFTETPQDRFMLWRYAEDNNFSELLKNFQLSKFVKKITIAVPDDEIMSKQLYFEQPLSETEVENLLHSELNQYLIDYTEPLAIDFRLLDPHSVFVIALPEQRLQKYLEKLPQQKTLAITAVDIESYAIARCLRRLSLITNSGEPFAIIILDEHEVRLYIMQSPFCIFSRTEMIISDWISAFKRGWEILISNYETLALSHVYIGGTLPDLVNKANQITANLTMPVTVVNPFTNMQIHSTQNLATIEQGPRYLLATGLALHG